MLLYYTATTFPSISNQRRVYFRVAFCFSPQLFPAQSPAINSPSVGVCMRRVRKKVRPLSINVWQLERHSVHTYPPPRPPPMSHNCYWCQTNVEVKHEKCGGSHLHNHWRELSWVERPPSRGVDPRGLGGLDPLKICRRSHSMFWPPPKTRSSADADNGLDAFVGQSRSKNILNPFQVK